MKQLRKSALAFFLAFGAILISSSMAFGHGGGLDSDGGHNCNVGSCAGTYHCHQAWGPGCGGGTSSSSASNTISPKCIDEFATSLTKRNWAKIQKLLKSNGYSPGTIDGKYGPRTKKALSEFESDNQLSSSAGSKVKRETLVALGAFCE